MGRNFGARVGGGTGIKRISRVFRQFEARAKGESKRFKDRSESASGSSLPPLVGEKGGGRGVGEVLKWTEWKGIGGRYL